MEPVDVATHEMRGTGEDSLMETGGWSGVCEVLRESVGEDSFQRWFRAADWAGHEEGVGTVTVPGEIHQVWVETNYLPELTVAVNQIFGEVREVRVVVGDQPQAGQPHHNGHSKQNASHHRPSKAAILEGEALDRRIKSSGLNPGNTFASFVVGSNSQFAHAACEAVAKKTGIGYNPLFIHGGPGLGKTHLMQAIGQEILQPPSRIARRLPDLREVHQRVHRFRAPRRSREVPPPLPELRRAAHR